MTGKTVGLAWKHTKYAVPQPSHGVRSTWIPPLLGFLRLSEMFYPTNLFRFQMPSPSESCHVFQDVGNLIYHFYQSLLRRCDLPTLCHLADLLLGFSTSSSLTPEMESTSNENRARLLQAVHDPPEPSPQTMQPAVTNGHGPTKVVAAPIKFASLDLW